MNEKLHTDVIELDDDSLMITVECPDELVSEIDARFDDVDVIDDFEREGPPDDWTMMHTVDIVIE